MRIVITLLALGAILQSCASPVDFDLGTLSSRHGLSLETHQECTLICRTYRPRDNFSVAKVAHNGRMLWYKGENEKCLHIQVLYKDKSPLFLHILYTKNDATENYYYIHRRDWIMCLKSEYDEALEKERIQTLNLESPNPLLGNIRKTNDKEMFVSNDKCRITRVDYGHRTLWETLKEKLLFYRLFYKDGKPIRLHLVYTNGKEVYELSDGLWKRVDVATEVKPEKPSVDSLDIRSPNNETCKIEDIGNPVYERVIVPKNEYKVTRIVDGSKLIKENDVNEYILKARVYLENKRPILLSLKYANVEDFWGLSDDGSWESMKKKNFNEGINKMKEELSRKARPNIIDLSKKNSDFYRFSEYEHFGIPTFAFTPIDNITEILYGNVLICKISEDTRVVKVLLHKAKRYNLIDVSFQKNGQRYNVYFISVGDTWEIIEKDTLRIEVTLDISNVNGTHFKKEKNGPLTVVFPKEEHNLTEINEGEAPIWKASGNEKCITVWVDCKDGQPNLMQILVENSNMAHQYFKKNGDGKWSSITEDVYNKAQN